MDLIDRFNAKFGRWYEGLFGADAGELRPRDVLRKIITAMEDGRREGFDGKTYVPNRYVLQLAVKDAAEREYLLSFLDEDELVGVLTRFMAQHGYLSRGPLDFTISEVPDLGPQAGKLVVVARFEKGSPEERKSAPAPVSRAPRAPAPEPVELSDDEYEPETVAVVARAGLAITGSDGKKRHFSLSKPIVTIGRSRRAANDVVLDDDGMVSKAHARIALEPDGQFSLYDLESTNGIAVNGKKIDGVIHLKDGDDILIGSTHLIFEEDAPGRVRGKAAPNAPAGSSAPYLTGADGDRHYLGSRTEIGSGLTADLFVNTPGVSTRHARIDREEEDLYYLTALSRDQETILNGRPLASGGRALLADGDRIVIGETELIFWRSGQ